MALQVSTEKHKFKTLEYTKKKGTRKKLFLKNKTRTENCEFSFYNFANFCGFFWAIGIPKKNIEKTPQWRVGTPMAQKNPRTFFFFQNQKLQKCVYKSFLSNSKIVKGLNHRIT